MQPDAPTRRDAVYFLNKVPEVTLGFWVIKILATTLGETGGDAVSMSLGLGYAISSIIFIGIFFAVAALQISAKAFHPFLYWLVIVATTTAGTTTPTGTPVPASTECASATQTGLTMAQAKRKVAASSHSFTTWSRVASGFRRV